MTLLRDDEIKELLTGTTPLIKDFSSASIGAADSPVLSAAIDLKVGLIFIPGKKGEDVGGPKNPEKNITISPGQIAVVQTKEYLQLPANIAGIGFPVSSRVSLAGLLTTNPGQVDPGYNGYLHLTVINMTNSPFPLKEGDRLMRLMLFKLSGNAQIQEKRKKDIAISPTIDDSLLNRLSVDFANVDTRVNSAIEKAVGRAELHVKSFQVWGTIAVAALAFFGVVFNQWATSAGANEDLKKQIARLEGRLTSFGTSVNLGGIDERISKIEAAIGSGNRISPPPK